MDVHAGKAVVVRSPKRTGLRQETRKKGMATTGDSSAVSNHKAMDSKDAGFTYIP